MRTPVAKETCAFTLLTESRGPEPDRPEIFFAKMRMPSPESLVVALRTTLCLRVRGKTQAGERPEKSCKHVGWKLIRLG